MAFPRISDHRRLKIIEGPENFTFRTRLEFDPEYSELLLSAVRRMSTSMADIEEKLANDALIAAGWTPPSHREADLERVALIVENLKTWTKPIIPETPYEAIAEVVYEIARWGKQ